LAVTVWENPYIPHTPTSRQEDFLTLLCREALYGGAAGGGKSDALLMAALQYIKVPYYCALLIRRTYADLTQPEALIPRSHEWLEGTDAKWSEKLRTWTWPWHASITFGYCESENDKYQYQGAAYQFIGFDETS